MTEEKIHHRGRINVTHVDHSVEFINRPYFSQDVSYGTKFLNLNSGETIEIPNAVRTVKRSAMISQYIQFCQEEKFEPLSRTTLFKILEVRRASQRKSLQGLDNTAADGSAGFQKIEMIVDDLEKGGMNRQWCAEVKERLKSRKRYLKWTSKFIFDFIYDISQILTLVTVFCVLMGAFLPEVGILFVT